MALTRRVHNNYAVISPAGVSTAAALLGFLLWFPAIGLPVGSIFPQPADILVILSYPLLIAYLPQVPSRVVIVISLSVTSAGAATLNGGDIMILVYYVGFLTPFTVFIGIVFHSKRPRRSFTQGFLLGAGFSAILFIAQFLIGADVLDFRNNRSFGLPPQFQRGFALMPEVSTYATHTIYALGMLIVLHRSEVRHRAFIGGRVLPLILLTLFCLLLSRSSSVILIAPAVIAVAYFKGRRLSWTGLLGVLFLVLIVSLFLQLYISNFYADRADGSALRSMGIRAISMLSGLSVLTSGDLLGVGLGNNNQITERALHVAREYGFSLLLLPEGVNSFVIARIFEEGWPALCMFCVAGTYLIRALFSKQEDPYARVLTVLALSSFLVSLLVTGYRGIYMNWLWLPAGAALLETASNSSRMKR